MLVTRMPRDSRIAAREAAAMPFPREETTPPVTKTYLVIDPRRVGMEEFTYIPRTSQMSEFCDAQDLHLREDSCRESPAIRSPSSPPLPARAAMYARISSESMW